MCVGDWMEHVIKISVRALVEYVFRSGSIETGFRTSTALTEGTKAHQKIQKTYKESDQKEVYLQAEISHQNLTFLIDGRCDGLLFNEDGSITIDEIKSSAHELTDEAQQVHWAQAIFYAYMYAREHELAQMNIQLTYVQIKTDEQRKFNRQMTYLELEAFINDVIKQYVPYAQARANHIQERDQAIKELQFPFETYRNGQRKLAGAVYKTILDQKNLFAKASTGIGKTISTIFPAVKAIGEGHLQKVFYLTAKTITRTEAEKAFVQLNTKLKVVTITAKDKVCFQEETLCTKEQCPFADGYYDRINEAILDIYKNETLMTRTIIEQYARKHMVCPFEYSLDLAYAADAVICDYNYIFDPRVSLKRLFEEQKKQTVLLIDEAHNLVDRAREMYSAELHESDFLHIKLDAAKAIAEYFTTIKNTTEKDLDEELITILDSFIMQAETELMQNQDPQLLETYFAAQSFVKISKLYDERYVTYFENRKLKLFCLDPSHLVQQMSKGYRSKVFFSATLTPAAYYKNLLGGQAEDYVISIASPFERDNVEIYIQPISTRYRDRERTMAPMVQFIDKIIQQKPGNFLVFFPSYQYMLAAYGEFTKLAPNVKTIVQDTKMTEDEREKFLEAFQPDNEEPLVGFAVLGGIFSEGVDLKGERLQGVIVVGVGLPQIGFERDIIKDYFQSIGRNGYDYAYVFPGMNKVLQAGGRLIRSETDRGTIILVDDRFLQPKYQALLPFEWQHFKVVR